MPTFKMLVMLIAELAIAMTSMVFAAVPPTVSYQGRLLDDADVPVADGAYLIKFKIYGTASGSDSLWTSGFRNITVTDGLFDYELGSIVAFPTNLFHASQRYLGITIGAELETTPRTKLTSVPWAHVAQLANFATNAEEAELAYVAEDADQLGGQPASNFVDLSSTQTITGTKTMDDLRVPTTTRRISLPPAAFVSINQGQGYSVYETYLISTQTTTPAFFYAPVTLPDGAVITQLSATTFDNDATYDIEVKLTRCYLGTSCDEMAIVTPPTNGQVTTYSDDTIDFGLVDNENYTYTIRATWAFTVNPIFMRLVGAEIEYTVTSPLP